MKISDTHLEDVKVIEPVVFGDARGYFMESYNQRRYFEMGIGAAFVQDNLSFSVQDTLRGLHYQLPHAQAKLVQVLQGEVFDVAVDIRRASPTFGKWTGVVLSSENQRQLFIPEGFAHGFCLLSKTALFMYKCSDYYHPECEGGILWCDPDIGIDWPVERPLLSEKDAKYPRLGEVPDERLPVYDRELHTQSRKP